MRSWHTAVTDMHPCSSTCPHAGLKACACLELMGLFVATSKVRLHMFHTCCRPSGGCAIVSLSEAGDEINLVFFEVEAEVV